METPAVEEGGIQLQHNEACTKAPLSQIYYHHYYQMQEQCSLEAADFLQRSTVS